MEREEKEKLFNEHVEALAKKKKELFRQLLDETTMVTVSFNIYETAFGHCSPLVSMLKSDLSHGLDHSDNDVEGGEEGYQGGSTLYQVLLQ